MAQNQCIFLEAPVVGQRAKILLNGQPATTSPVTNVQAQAVAGHPCSYMVNTQSGSTYIGHLQAYQPTQYSTPTTYTPPVHQQQVNINITGWTKKRSTAVVLAWVIGGLGAHKFYLGQWIWGIIYICFVWTFIPAIIAFIEGIIYLTQSDEEFNRRYN